MSHRNAMSVAVHPLDDADVNPGRCYASTGFADDSPRTPRHTDDSGYAAIRCDLAARNDRQLSEIIATVGGEVGRLAAAQRRAQRLSTLPIYAA
jgi:hypothetical protein